MGHSVLLVTCQRVAQVGDSQDGDGHCTAPEEPAAPWFVCVVLQRVKMLKQPCRSWSRRGSVASKCLSHEHRKQQEMVRDTFLELWMALPPSWLGAHLVSSCHLVSCTPMVPGSARAICFLHTSYDLVFFWQWTMLLGFPSQGVFEQQWLCIFCATSCTQGRGFFCSIDQLSCFS